MLDMTPSTSLPSGNFFIKLSYGFSKVSLCDIAILLFYLSISVITQSIKSPTLNNFFGATFLFVQLISLLCNRVLSLGLMSKNIHNLLFYLL